MVEALATVTPALVVSDKGAPDPAVLRRALYGWAFNPNMWVVELGAAERSALDWIERVSQPVVRMTESDVIRAALNACARKMDGKPTAATVVNRKRAVLYKRARVRS